MQPASPIVRGSILLAALIAAAVSAYLTWAALQRGGSAPGCIAIGGSDCDEVLQSRWSQWLGLPVSGAATLLYAAITVAAAFVGESTHFHARRTAWLLLLGMAGLAAGAALWFLGLQWLVIGSGCVFCIAVHACGLFVFGLVVAAGPFRGDREPADAVISARLGGVIAANAPARNEWPDRDRVPMPAAAGVLTASALALGALVLGQSLYEPPLEVVVAELDESTPGESPQPRDPTATRPVEQASEPAAREDPELPPPAESQGAPEQEPIAATSSAVPAVAPPTSEGAAESPTVGEPEVLLPPVESRQVTILRGAFELDSQDTPRIGSAAADHFVVLLSDYTCPHCRKLHGFLDEARASYGDQLAVLVLPMPMNSSCNRLIQATQSRHVEACKLARLATAVWIADPDAFEEFDRWLFATRTPPSAADAEARAVELVGRERLDEARRDRRIERHIQRGIDVFERAGLGKMPKLILGDEIVNGEPASASQLCDQLERSLGIRPR